MNLPLPDIDMVLFDIGGTLVAEAPPATPVDLLRATPLPGAVELLEALGRHHRLGAVTDTTVMDEATVRGLLRPVGLDDPLEIVVTSHDVGAAKPDPRGILAACRALGVAPERTLFVGDRDVDRDAASAAGTSFVAVDRGVADALDRFALTGRSPYASLPSFVPPLDADAMGAADARQATLTKPAGALGRLESLGTHLAGITGRCPPPVPHRPAVAVFAADHGVARAGVTPWPQDVTQAMVANFARGGAAINVLAQQVGASVHIVDVGVAGDLSGPGIRHRKVRPGTDDLSQGPAMSTEEAWRAIKVGAELATELVAEGCDLLVTGEMGIGNTTASAALIAALTRTEPTAVTGRGTGIDDAMLAHKSKVVIAAVERAKRYLDPVSVLAEIGGLEIGALAGFVVAGTAARIPVIVDGVIACAALLVAEHLAPGTAARCIAGHRSTEPGATIALAHLGLEPLLDLRLRLGEGTGACLAVPIVQSAARVLRDMATFDELELDGSA